MAKEIQKYPVCKDCGQERKPILFAGGRKKTMKRACNCGVFDIDGKLIYSYN